MKTNGRKDTSQTHTIRDKDRQTDRQTDRKADRQKDRQIDSGTKKHYTNKFEMENKYKQAETNIQRERVI